VLNFKLLARDLSGSAASFPKTHAECIPDDHVNLTTIFSQSPPKNLTIECEAPFELRPSKNELRTLFLPFGSATEVCFLESHGSFAPNVYQISVVRLQHRVSNMALKYCDENSKVHRARREAEILGNLTHQHIVRLYAAFHFIMPGKNQSLLFLEQGRMNAAQFKFKASAFASFQRHVLNGLEHIHKNNIIHRDLKPQNILVIKPQAHAKRALFKIADFNYAQRVTDTDPEASPAGTNGYKAPEVEAGGNTTKKSDMWSYGASVMAIYFNEEIPTPDHLRHRPTVDPFGLLSNQNQVKLFRASFKTLNNIPNQRPSASQLLQEMELIF